jgi:hypothetical protein
MEMDDKKIKYMDGQAPGQPSVGAALFSVSKIVQEDSSLA